MANLNYVGSISERKMKFRSTVDVVVNNANELFNALSVYVPKRFAAQSIIGWNDTYLTPERPAVYVAVVDNYAGIMTGDLLAQWQPVFRQDTNGDVIIYLIVFDDEQAGEWDIQSQLISYGPLTAAFNALFPFSYFKFLFDPYCDGRDVTIPASAGKPAEMRIRLINSSRAGIYARQDVVFTNPLSGTPATSATIQVEITNGGAASADIVAGDYAFTPGLISYAVNVPVNLTVAAGATETLTFTAVSTGSDPAWTNTGAVILTTGTLPTDFTAQAIGGANGNAGSGGGSITLPEGTYTYNDGAKIWNIIVPQEYIIDPSGGQLVIPNVRPTAVGFDPNLTEAADITTLFYGTLPPAGLVVTSTRIYAGENPGAGANVTINAGDYIYNDGAKSFTIGIPTAMTLKPDDISSQVYITADTVGIDANLGQGLVEDNMLDLRAVIPAMPAGIIAQVAGTTQGIEPVPAPLDAPSQYFDLSLALAYLCKNNIALSWMWSLVGISYDRDDNTPNPQDKCWIRYETRANQIGRMTSLLTGDRARYYWGALYLLQCQNTCVIVHSEDRDLTTGALAPPAYIIADILAAWFAQRNASGTYIGNKLSLLRLSGTRIKPLGWPSWLDSSIRENDTGVHQLPTGGTVKGVDELDDMNVGYLTTIADNTPQESALSMARGVGDIDKGIPVSMMMIAKFVDYTCSQEAAKMVTDTGTLTNPILTDEDAYDRIQALVSRTLGRFATSNGRIFNVLLQFPDFVTAKTSRTALTAASAWKAWYKDDLDEVEVSGGITAE